MAGEGLGATSLWLGLEYSFSPRNTGFSAPLVAPGSCL